MSRFMSEATLETKRGEYMLRRLHQHFYVELGVVPQPWCPPFWDSLRKRPKVYELRLYPATLSPYTPAPVIRRVQGSNPYKLIETAFYQEVYDV